MTVVSVSVVVCPFVTKVVVCTTVVNKVVTPVVVEVVTAVDDCTIGTVEEMVMERDDSGRLEVGLTLARTDEDSGKEVIAPELDSGIVVEKGSVVGNETGMDGTEMGMVTETEKDVGMEVGNEVGMDIGREVGMEIGIDVGMDVGIDVGIEMGKDIDIVVGMEIGFEVMGRDVGREIVIDDGMEMGIEVGTDMLMELGILVTGMDMDVVVTALLEVVGMKEVDDGEGDGLADVDGDITEAVEERKVGRLDGDEESDRLDIEVAEDGDDGELGEALELVDLDVVELEIGLELGRLGLVLELELDSELEELLLELDELDEVVELELEVVEDEVEDDEVEEDEFEVELKLKSSGSSPRRSEQRTSEVEVNAEPVVVGPSPNVFVRLLVIVSELVDVESLELVVAESLELGEAESPELEDAETLGLDADWDAVALEDTVSLLVMVLSVV
ncbi:hypothetical protein C8T65DRAFT_698519 [Cerioporus squamosus]|nr:hypothetical protein C8T65DRAFT_698519 [Cerioporus squamosus]